MDVPNSPKSQSRPRPKQTASAASGSLHLSALPRFHPAAYSTSSSKSASPANGSSVNSPVGAGAYGGPLSPKSAFRFFEPAQRQQLSYYQQHLLQASLGGATTPNTSGKKPESPKLQPSAGSPGPVTPLELEDEVEGYFSAGRKSPLNVDALIREEKKRLADYSPRKTS
jgi:hypothetical protein